MLGRLCSICARDTELRHLGSDFGKPGFTGTAFVFGLGRLQFVETRQQNATGVARNIGGLPEPFVTTGPAPLDVRHGGSVNESDLPELVLREVSSPPESRKASAQGTAQLGKVFGFTGHVVHALRV
jgi:hypothetical protein